jgi:hypothetical protein
VSMSGAQWRVVDKGKNVKCDLGVWNAFQAARNALNGLAWRVGWNGEAFRGAQARAGGRAGREEAVLASGQERMEVWEGLFE